MWRKPVTPHLRGLVPTAAENRALSLRFVQRWPHHQSRAMRLFTLWARMSLQHCGTPFPSRRRVGASYPSSDVGLRSHRWLGRLFNSAEPHGLHDFLSTAALSDLYAAYTFRSGSCLSSLPTRSWAEHYKDSVAATVQRLGVKARAAGIHLVFAAQRPDANVMPIQIDVADENSPRLYLIASNHGQLLEKLKSDAATDAAPRHPRAIRSDAAPGPLPPRSRLATAKSPRV